MKSPTKAKTDKPLAVVARVPKPPLSARATTKRKSHSLTKSENDSVVENQDGDGFESSSSPNKQRKLQDLPLLGPAIFREMMALTLILMSAFYRIVRK